MTRASGDDGAARRRHVRSHFARNTANRFSRCDAEIASIKKVLQLQNCLRVSDSHEFALKLVSVLVGLEKAKKVEAELNHVGAAYLDDDREL